MSRELRLCPGVGDRKCGAFLSTLDRDPHPTCARCRGKICTKDLTCDFCAVWSAEQWERFTKKGRNIALQALFLLLSRPPPRGNFFGSFAPWYFFFFLFPPFRGAGEVGGVSGCTWCCVWRGSLSSRSTSVQREGWECLWAFAPFPRLRFWCLSPILTARSTTWEFEGDIGILLPRVILPWFPIFRSRIKEG